MAEYPRSIPVGTGNYRTVYQLQDSDLLLQFDANMPDERIDEFLKARKLEPRATETLRRGDDMLRAARMRWVRAPGGATAAHELARSLLERGEVAMAAPIYFAEGQGRESAASPLPDTVVVRFRDETSSERASRQIEELGLVRNKVMSELLKPFHYFALGPQQRRKQDTFELVERVRRLPGVVLVEFDWLKLETYQQVTPNDTFWANQWDMARIGMPNAWDVETGTATVVVAIIDSGFDLAHPDLVFTANTAPNYTHFNAEEALAGNPPPYNAGPSGVPHGTACAGLAAAAINNNAGVAGVAGGCSIMPVRLGTIPSSDRVAAGINWAANHGALVGSLSLTTTATAAATTAVANAWAAGMVLCAATGNGGSNASSPPVGFPANHANVIAVGASDQADERKRPASADGESWGSQYGAEIDVIAPGVRLWTTDEQGNNGYNLNGGPASIAGVNYASSGDAAGNYYALFGGTSGATPHVAGLAALLFSAYPALTNQQVRDIIERTCDKVNPGMYAYAHDAAHPSGTWHEQVGYGRINCDAALHLADIMIADHDLDTGAVPSSALIGSSWNPKVFWEYQPYVTTASQPAALPAAHEPAKAGQDNYVHAVVANLGPATAENILVTWHIMDYPGTELIYPADWNATNQIASASIASLAAGASSAIEATWPAAKVDIAAGYVHPCMVVRAACARDVGGDLGDSVYQYNNIAQHNISFAGFSSVAAAHGADFAMAFAAGNAVSRARRIKLLVDARRAYEARVYLDISPDAGLPYVDRIRDVNVLRPAKKHGGAGCVAVAAEDARFLLMCHGCRAEVILRKGSMFRMLGAEAIQQRTLEDLRWTGGVSVMREGRKQLLVEGAIATLELPLEEGEVVPLAIVIQVPPGAAAGRQFRVDVTQVSESVGAGGVSLVVRAT